MNLSAARDYFLNTFSEWEGTSESTYRLRSSVHCRSERDPLGDLYLYGPVWQQGAVLRCHRRLSLLLSNLPST
jgi:hypothetical protein